MSADTTLLNDLLAQVIRVGFVVARDEAAMRVRVEIVDTTTEALTTDFLQVLVPRAQKDRVYDLPDLDDQVLCLFLPFAREAGFVIGSMYGEVTPPVSSGDKWHRTFADGAVLEYDRAAHKLMAKIPGAVEVTASGEIVVTSSTKITLMAPEIELNGNLTSRSSGGTQLLSSGTVSINAAHVSLNEGCE